MGFLLSALMDAWDCIWKLFGSILEGTWTSKLLNPFLSRSTRMPQMIKTQTLPLDVDNVLRPGLPVGKDGPSLGINNTSAYCQHR